MTWQNNGVLKACGKSSMLICDHRKCLKHTEFCRLRNYCTPIIVMNTEYNITNSQKFSLYWEKI